jgi:prepilin-type N-terminal cleavage/methylation domain-containing protein
MVKSQQSFTIVELLIVIALVAVIASIGIVSLFGYRQRQHLKLQTEELVAVLRNAQNRSLSQESGSRWGVHFENPTGDANDFYDLFSGTSYSASAVVSRTPLPPALQFDVPSSGASATIIFAPVTGFPNASTTIKISLVNNPNASSAITINSNGVINF